MVRTVSPHNDYFSAQFLLEFPVTGLHQVHIEASMVDRDERRWNVGTQQHMASLLVKSYDEVAQRQQQINYANSQAARHVVPVPTTSTSTRTTGGTVDKEFAHRR